MNATTNARQISTTEAEETGLYFVIRVYSIFHTSPEYRCDRFDFEKYRFGCRVEGKECFLSIDECRKECDRLNAELQQKWCRGDKAVAIAWE